MNYKKINFLYSTCIRREIQVFYKKTYVKPHRDVRKKEKNIKKK